MSSPLRRPRQPDENTNDDNNLLPAPVSPPNTAASTTSLHDRLLSLLNEVFSADSHKKMFHFPASSQDLPEYKNIIKNPMDLTTIKKKILEDKKNSNGTVAAPPPSSGTFASPLITEVYNNLNLMISNALVFNKGRKNPYRRHAKKIQKVIDAAWEKRPELEVAEDDIDFVPDEDAEDEEDFEDEENENTNNNKNDMMIVDEDDDGGSSSAMKNSKKDGNEDIAATVKALEEEAAEPIDVLKAKYAKLMMEQQQEDDDSDDDDEDDEEEESDDDFDDEEEEEEESDDDDESDE